MRNFYKSHIEPHLPEIEAWARDGLDEKTMARNCRVSETTWKKYKSTVASFAALLARNKSYVDNVVVVNAYLKRVIGYDVDEPTKVYKYEYHEDGTVEKVLVKETVTTRHIPGDPRAGEFWLSRRMGDKWPMAVRAVADLIPEEQAGGGVVLIPEVKAEEPLEDGKSVGAATETA